MKNLSGSSAVRASSENVPVMPLTIPAFMGYTGKSLGSKGEDLTLVPTLIGSLSDYEKIFGKAAPFKFPIFPEKGGNGRKGRVRLELRENVFWVERGMAPYYLLYPSLKLYFENGGSECWIVSIGDFGPAGALNIPQATDFEAGLKALEEFLDPHPTLILAPDLINLSPEDSFQVNQQMLAQAGNLHDRFVLLDLPLDAGSDHKSNIHSFYTGIGNQFLSHGAAWYPGLEATVVSAGDCSLENIDDLSVGAVMADALLPSGADNREEYQAVLNALAEQANRLPSSPALAAVISRLDRTEGLKAVTGSFPLSGVRGPLTDIDLEANASLFLDTTSWKSLNAIKTDTGSAVVNAVGARSLAARDEVFGFISSRLIITYVEKAIRDFLENYIFEPNNQQTWKNVETKVDAFLRRLWEQGLLYGDHKTKAWFVAIGLGRSMTDQDINRGLMRLQVGLAVNQPAEYVTAEFIQNMGAG